MQIDSTFSVVAPIDQVWDTLMDFERVAGCLPGARILNKLSDDAYQVGMTVKLGPVTMQYKGLLNVIERNAAEHRAVLGGKAQETRGQGTAEATVTLVLAEDGAATRGSVSADLALSGKAAAMGKGVIGSVTEQMMSLFADNLQAMLAEGAPPAPEAVPVPDGRPGTGPGVGRGFCSRFRCRDDGGGTASRRRARWRGGHRRWTRCRWTLSPPATSRAGRQPGCPEPRQGHRG